jgi:hypothetical protein
LICVSLTTVNVVAGVPLNDTAVAPVKDVPVIVTTVPATPDVGEKLPIPGSGFM